jgi:hypothetical protein
MNDQREPMLEDLLKEPIIISVMARDGVRAADIRHLLERVRARREQGIADELVARPT